MKLLDFTLPSYARIQWASQDLKEFWEPKLLLASKASARLEVLSVFHGLRKASTVNIDDSKMQEFKKDISDLAIFFVPIKKNESNSKSGQKRISWFGAISLDINDAYDLVKARQENNQEEIERLNGFPKCCMDFSRDIRALGYNDLSWHHAQNSLENVKKKEENFIRFSHTANQHISPFLRYVGIKVLPFVSCSCNCQESIDMANKWIELGRAENVEGLEELLDLVSMPAEWDCFKGIAYVSTPIFKIEASSLTCYPKYIIQKEGVYFPENAPRGLKFPWNEFTRKKKEKVKL